MNVFVPTGSSLLKNLTTSPFLQRKQTQAPAPQSAVPQIPIETQQRSKFPSQHQPRPLEMSGNSQLPRPTFHQYSPLLQRRNPSYVTYGECNASPNKGRSSANTSPIGECEQRGGIRQEILILCHFFQCCNGFSTSRTSTGKSSMTNDNNSIRL